MLNIPLSNKEITLITKLVGGYRKSQEGQNKGGNLSLKVEWSRNLEAKFLKAEEESFKVLTANFYESTNTKPAETDVI